MSILAAAALSGGCGGGSGSSSTSKQAVVREHEWAAAATAHRFMVEDIANFRPFHATGSAVVQCAAKKFEAFIPPKEWSQAIEYHVGAMKRFLVSCEPVVEREEDEIKRGNDKKAEETGSSALSSASEQGYKEELEKQQIKLSHGE